MNANAWILVSLAVLDSLLLSVLWFSLRTASPLQRSALLPVAMGLAGFVFHAVLFFRGAVLMIQLATIAVAFCLFWIATTKPQRDKSTR